MTKALSIDTSAAWAGTITTIQDGDPASEATMDVVMDSVADRLGYLKNSEANALKVASDSNVTVSGARTITFGNTNVTFNGNASVTGANGMSVATGSRINFSADSYLVANHSRVYGALGLDFENLPNANATMGAVYESRVPTITANRTYQLPNPASTLGTSAFMRKRVSRYINGTHIVYIEYNAVQIALIQQTGAGLGFVDFVFDGAANTWVVSAMGGVAALPGV